MGSQKVRHDWMTKHSTFCFLSLICCAAELRALCNKSERAYFCLVADLRKKGFICGVVMLAVGSFYFFYFFVGSFLDSLDQTKKFSLKFFLLKGIFFEVLRIDVKFCWIFFWINGYDHIFLFLPVNMVDCINWFLNIELSLHSWNKSLVMLQNSFYIFVEFCLLVFCWGFLHLC